MIENDYHYENDSHLQIIRKPNIKKLDPSHKKAGYLPAFSLRISFSILSKRYLFLMRFFLLIKLFINSSLVGFRFSIVNALLPIYLTISQKLINF